MIKINPTKRQLFFFNSIIDRYYSKTTFPKRDYWRSLSNDDLWFWMVGQVMVVGSSAGSDRFQQRPDLKSKLDYSALTIIETDEELKLTINSVLREIGVRYASTEIASCHKTNALAYNLRKISEYKNGFIGLMTELSTMEGETAELDRVRLLMRRFKYLKNKSSRDFLMSMGVNKNTLAIDVRIQNTFNHAGIPLPTPAELVKEAIYDETERQIIEKICNNLDIEPMKFDRIIYQNYSEIMKD